LIFGPSFPQRDRSAQGWSVDNKDYGGAWRIYKSRSIVAKGSTFSLTFLPGEKIIEGKMREYMKCSGDKDSTIRCPISILEVCWAWQEHSAGKCRTFRNMRIAESASFIRKPGIKRYKQRD
jgi:hypothetical protein